MLSWWKGSGPEASRHENTARKGNNEELTSGSFFGGSFTAGKKSKPGYIINEEYETAMKVVSGKEKHENSKRSTSVQRTRNDDNAAMSIVGTFIEGKGNVDEDFRAAVLRIREEEDKARVALDKIWRKFELSNLQKSSSLIESAKQKKSMASEKLRNTARHYPNSAASLSSNKEDETNTGCDETFTDVEATTISGVDETSTSKVVGERDDLTRGGDRSFSAESSFRTRRMSDEDDNTANSWYEDLRQYHIERFDDPQLNLVERTFLGCDSFSTSSLDQMCGVVKGGGCFSGNQRDENLVELSDERDPIAETRSVAADTASTSISRHQRSFSVREVDDKRHHRAFGIKESDDQRRNAHKEGKVPSLIGVKQRSARTPTAIRGQNKTFLSMPKVEDIKLVGGVVQEWKQKNAIESLPKLHRRTNFRKIDNASHSTINGSHASHKQKYYLDEGLSSSVISERRPEGYGTLILDESDKNAQTRAVSPLSFESGLQEPNSQRNEKRLSMISSNNFFGDVIASDSFRRSYKRSDAPLKGLSHRESFYFDTRVASTQQERDEVLAPVLRQMQERESNAIPRPESPSGLTCSSDEPSLTTQQVTNKSTPGFFDGRGVNIILKDFTKQDTQRKFYNEPQLFYNPQERRDHRRHNSTLFLGRTSDPTTWTLGSKPDTTVINHIPPEQDFTYDLAIDKKSHNRDTSLHSRDLIRHNRDSDPWGPSRSKKSIARPVPLKKGESGPKPNFIDCEPLPSSRKFYPLQRQGLNSETKMGLLCKDGPTAYESELAARGLHQKRTKQCPIDQVSSSRFGGDYRKKSRASLSNDYENKRHETNRTSMSSRRREKAYYASIL